MVSWKTIFGMKHCQNLAGDLTAIAGLLTAKAQIARTRVFWLLGENLLDDDCVSSWSEVTLISYAEPLLQSCATGRIMEWSVAIHCFAIAAPQCSAQMSWASVANATGICKPFGWLWMPRSKNLKEGRRAFLQAHTQSHVKENKHHQVDVGVSDACFF